MDSETYGATFLPNVAMYWTWLPSSLLFHCPVHLVGQGQDFWMNNYHKGQKEMKKLFIDPKIKVIIDTVTRT